MEGLPGRGHQRGLQRTCQECRGHGLATALAGGSQRICRRRHRRGHGSQPRAERDQALPGGWKNDLAAMIKVVVAGGIWTRRRRIEAGDMASPICTRCGVAVEDEWHVGYSCIDNCRWSEGKDSQHIVDRALREGTSTPCLWLRGLIPESMRPNAPHPLENGWRDHGLQQGWFVPRECDSGWTVLAGDASGGRYASMARYRRVGVGLSQVGLGDG